jgi:hypothetical protein
MTGKEVNEEKKMIEAHRTRIKNLEKLFKHTRIDVKESVMTRINVLKYKIAAAEERIERKR